MSDRPTPDQAPEPIRERMEGRKEQFDASQALEDNKAPNNDFDVPSRKNESSYYNLKKMNQLHHEIVRRIVVGQKDHIIADALGVSKAMIKYTRESPVVKQKLDIMMGARDASSTELLSQIRSLAPLALDHMTEMLEDDSTPHGVRSKVAMDILDRAGYKPANVNVDASESFNQERISEIKKRAKHNGVMIEQVEDAEYEETED